MIGETPQVLAQKGEEIYDKKFKKEYEQKYQGKFVAIDIGTEQAFLADTPEDALLKAQKESPNGFYHLIKVGSTGVYRVGYTNSAHGDWLFRQRRAAR
jgi:hypothetical protein